MYRRQFISDYIKTLLGFSFLPLSNILNFIDKKNITRINSKRLNKNLKKLQFFGKNKDGGIDRMAFSNADRDARKCHTIYSAIFIYPGDFFKLRDFTVSVPVPVKISGINSMMVKFSAKNAYRWLNDDFPLFDPEMVSGGGRLTGSSTSGYHSSRSISEHIPSTASYTLSLRVSF